MGKTNMRLREARIASGYRTAAEAARVHRWPLPTYYGHENGDRPISKAAAERYAAAYRIEVTSLLYEVPPRPGRRGESLDVERLTLMVAYLLQWRGLPEDEAEILARGVTEFACKPPTPGEGSPDRDTARIEARAVVRMLSLASH